MKLLSQFAVRIASTSLIGSAISLSMLSTSALAETFQVSGNKSLNTNNQFSYIDGHPRMAVYDSNNSDPDQNFDRLAGKWGVLFRNRSTKMCINAYYNRDGGAVSNWPCDANDPAQNFDLLGQGGNIVLLRKSNTNFCLNVPYHVNEGQVTAWTCNTNDVDQRFLMSNVTGSSGGSGVLYPPITVPTPVPATKPIPAVVPKPTPSPVITYVVDSATPLYEYWIVSRKTDTFWGIWSPLNATEVGHSFTAIIRKNQKVTKTFRNGTLVAVSTPQDNGNWYPFHTYGYWDKAPILKIDNGSADNKGGSEWRNVKDILSGVSISQSGWGVRKMRISENRANYIHTNFNLAGCEKYLLAGGYYLSLKNCNCVDYATRQWFMFTAQRSSENFTPENDAKTPSGLVDNINSRNYFSGSDFVDNGKIWN